MITLTRYGLENTQEGCSGPWSIRVVASSEDGSDTKIFIYHAPESTDELALDTFYSVANLNDLNNIPEDKPALSPDPGLQIPFYRVSEASFDCYTVSELEDIWRRIKRYTAELQREISAAEDLTEEEVVVIG